MKTKLYFTSVLLSAIVFMTDSNAKEVEIEVEVPNIEISEPNIEISEPEVELVEPEVELVEPEVDLVQAMVDNTAITKKDADLALQVAKSYNNYKEVFLLQMTVMKIESDFVHLGMNESGDVGIMQLNDATWEGHKARLGNDWSAYDILDNIEAGTHEILQCVEKAKELHPADWIRWSYIYYNRGKSVEYSHKWQDEGYRETSFVRADKFSTYYHKYQEILN